LDIPVSYLSLGEQLDEFQPFNSHEYIQNLLD